MPAVQVGILRASPTCRRSSAQECWFGSKLGVAGSNRAVSGPKWSAANGVPGTITSRMRQCYSRGIPGPFVHTPPGKRTGRSLRQLELQIHFGRSTPFLRFRMRSAYTLGPCESVRRNAVAIVILLPISGSGNAIPCRRYREAYPRAVAAGPCGHGLANWRSILRLPSMSRGFCPRDGPSERGRGLPLPRRAPRPIRRLRLV